MKFSVKDHIVYLDNHLFALEKPKGLLTQPSPVCTVSLQELAKEYIKERFEKKGNVFLHPIHRLDKEVSGIVLFARTSKALSRLQNDLREQKILRTYYAAVEGCVEKEQGVLEHYLVHGDHKAFEAAADRSGAKKASLFFKIIEKDQEKSHLQIELQTGRYHQIRAQLALIGHPILGDEKYGSRFKDEPFGLKHIRMELDHPVTKNRIVFSV
jgi:23S rRNA pseudouridine1911/1915/1917 synthase